MGYLHSVDMSSHDTYDKKQNREDIKDIKRHVRILRSISMTEFPVFPFSPGVDFSFAREGQGMFPSRIDGNFLDVDVLDGLQHGRGWHRIGDSDAQPTAGSVARCVYLPEINDETVKKWK